MIHLPTIDLISIPKSNENEKNEASFDFRRFKLKKITKMNHSLQIKLNIVNKDSNAKNQVAFGSSQERRKPSGKKFPPLQYDLNFKSVDRHQASPKLRTIRSTRIKSEVSQQYCERFPYSFLKTETIEQTIQPTKLNCLQKLIKKVRSPKIELQSSIMLKQDEFIPMSSKELKESLISLMHKYGIRQNEIRK
ncbi:unnamed protein product [Paramecium pentaurelia]|uniref:Uncharacterized protein n=1 Tax=Paramecium pentaurelia TaxID=43138 RepID=A0A8S1S9I7_9CILI|nr:unnamed protein product [Paramecium pentaurelia]